MGSIAGDTGGLAGLTALAREAEALASRLRHAQDAVPDEEVGRDPSGQVAVALDARGRLTEVELAADWRDHLDHEDLGSAVMAAYADGCQQRFRLWAQAVTETPGTWSRDIDQPCDDPNYSGRDAGGRFERTASPGTQSDVGLGEQSTNDLARGLLHVVQVAVDRIDDLLRDTQERGPTEVDGRDSRNRVTITVVSDQVTSVRFTPEWLAQADAADISDAVEEATVEAYVTCDRLATDALANQWPFTELRLLAAQPLALFNGLGLTATPTKRG